MPSIAAVLLAAGRSSRMNTPKALLPWGNASSIISYQIENLSAAGLDPIITVVGHDHQLVSDELSDSNTQIVINQDYDNGRSSSIIKGLSNINTTPDGILIISVDQPRSKTIIKTLIDKWIESKALIATPSFNGKSGHPIIFHCSLMRDLLSITEEKMGLREIILKYQDQRIFIPMNDPHVITNINTPEDYSSALEMYKSTN